MPNLREASLDRDEVVNIWKAADCVCFDVDSTVVTNECIDEIAEYAGVGEAVREYTRKAMNGEDPAMTFRKALNARLRIIKPSRQLVQRYLSDHPPQLTPGISELVNTLQNQQVDIYLVSGGFRCVIERIADKLGIPRDNIFANNLTFMFDGTFAGFDTTEPTSESGGKAEVAKLLKARNGYQNLVFVGDGKTDWEACPPADAFIGFGGNVEREFVKRNAMWFVTDFNDLTIELMDRCNTGEKSRCSSGGSSR